MLPHTGQHIFCTIVKYICQTYFGQCFGRFYDIECIFVVELAALYFEQLSVMLKLKSAILQILIIS